MVQKVSGISEVLQVVAQDIVFKRDAVLPAGFKHEALIRLGKAKTGEEQLSFRNCGWRLF